MPHAPFRLALLALFATGAATATAQTLPTTQPPILSLYIEKVKIGHSAAHTKHEAGWPAAFAKAKSVNYYLAMEAMTGEPQVWYVAPYESHAAIAAEMKTNEADAALSAELDRLSKGDAEHLESFRMVQARARTDLSHGTFPDLNQQRFWEITLFHLKPGHEMGFAEAAKAYKSASSRANPDANWRVYEVIAGMESPTYLIFSSVADYAKLDAMMAAGEKTMMSATQAEMEKLGTFMMNGVEKVITHRFRLSPTMSYVAEDVKKADPDFWAPKTKVAGTP